MNTQIEDGDPIEAPEAELNLTLTLRDDDTDIESTTKVHIYGSSEAEVLRSVSKSVLELLKQVGLVKGGNNDGEGLRS